MSYSKQHSMKLILLILISFVSSAENEIKKLTESNVKETPITPSNGVKMFKSFSSSFIRKTDLNGNKVENKINKAFNYSNINGKEDKKFQGAEYETQDNNGEIKKFGEIYHKENNKPMHIKQKVTSNTEQDKLLLKDKGVVEKDIIDENEEHNKLGEFSNFFKSSKNLKSNENNDFLANIFNFKGFESSFTNRFDSFIKSQMLK